ncbi:MAG: DUF4160 domain-containing protein [Planctomycetota bacterium]
MKMAYESLLKNIFIESISTKVSTTLDGYFPETRGANCHARNQMFYGVIVSLYFMDNKQHKRPHIHVRYQDDEAVISIPEGHLLDGRFSRPKMRLVQAWVEIHRDELIADWELAVKGQTPYKIDPLK